MVGKVRVDAARLSSAGPKSPAGDGKLVKQVGDGFMLAFRDPGAAVHFAVATQAELARDPELPAIRVGINTGPALYRTGDYRGSAVNVASRVVNSAMPGQILLTEPVATAASRAGIEIDELGVRIMRGVDNPLAPYRLRPALKERGAGGR
jgi:adenylate cyclase